MILIADSSALVTLAIVDKLDVLVKLFNEVYIPQAVYDEITQDKKPLSKRLSTYFVDKVVSIDTDINFNISLGKGESEAIVLYQQKNADFLLCDDKKAKKFAQSFGIKVVGSLGILLKAKEKNLIKEISPLLDMLKNSSIFIDDKTYQLVLKMAKED